MVHFSHGKHYKEANHGFSTSHSPPLKGQYWEDWLLAVVDTADQQCEAENNSPLISASHISQPFLSPVQKFCKRPQKHWPVLAGLPSSAWAAASGGPPSRHIPGWRLRRSGQPGAVPQLSAVPAGHSGASSARKWHERGTGHKGRRDRSMGTTQAWYGRGWSEAWVGRCRKVKEF